MAELINTKLEMRLLFLLILLLVLEPVRASWDAVQALPVGTRISVVTLEKSWTGRVESASVDSVVLCTKGKLLRSIAKSSIRKVNVSKPLGRRWAAVGVAVLTGTLALGVIPEKLYDLPKRITVGLGLAATVPTVYALYRVARPRTIYRAPNP